MSDVVRTGTIIINLKSGKVELDSPGLAQVLGQKKEELGVQEQINDSVKRTTESHREAAFATQRLYNESIEGAFRLSRAMVLLGVDSDQSLQKMIKNLASVHAGIDLFKGATATIKGMSLAFGASEAAAAGLLTKLNPYVAAIAAAASGYALLAARAREAAAAEQELFEQRMQAQRVAQDVRQSFQDRTKAAQGSSADSKFSMMSDEEKLRELQRQRQALAGIDARMDRAVARDPFSDRKATMAAESQAAVDAIESRIKPLVEAVERANREKLEAIERTVDDVGDALGGSLTRLFQKLGIVEKEHGLLERVVRDFTRM